MGEKLIATPRYDYVHEKGNWPSGVIDIHHVRVLRAPRLMWVVFLSLVMIAMFVLLKDDLGTFLLCYLIPGVLFIRLLLGKQVVKESILILPAFGVQLETHYKCGRVARRFVPINKILKPVLNECVTPVTCYWSLALLLREEDELMLVFKELHPTLEVNTVIWKALCSGIDPK